MEREKKENMNCMLVKNVSLFMRNLCHQDVGNMLFVEEQAHSTRPFIIVVLFFQWYRRICYDISVVQV